MNIKQDEIPITKESPIEKVYILKSETENLLTKEIGIVIHEELSKVIMTMEEKILCLDFRYAGIMDFSCANEIIVKLVGRIQDKEFGDKFLILSNLSPNHLANIDPALKLSKKNVLIKDVEQKWDVLGKMKKNSKEILNVIMDEKEITVRGIRECLDNKMDTALISSIVFYLYKNGLIYKKKYIKPIKELGGNRFLYCALF